MPKSKRPPMPPTYREHRRGPTVGLSVELDDDTPAERARKRWKKVKQESGPLSVPAPPPRKRAPGGGRKPLYGEAMASIFVRVPSDVRAALVARAKVEGLNFSMFLRVYLEKLARGK